MKGRSIEEFEKNICKRLKLRRSLMGILPERIAFVISIDPADYTRMENAEINVPADQLVELAFLLDVPLHYFLQELK